MVGELPDPSRAAGSGFARDGDAIVLVGDFAPARPASELAKLHGDPLPDGLPPIDLAAVRATHATVRDAVRSGAVRSCHDIAEGGLAIALAECCLLGGVGASVDVAGLDLFGEQPGRAFLLSGAADDVAGLGRVLGTVGGGELRIGDLSLPLAELRAAHGALAPLFP
jgi:phosphoribosylformylglycinamidine synthase